MSTFVATNFIIKLSFNLQPRLLSLPWLKKSVVRCFAHKADDSEPLRYIPKKLRDVNQTKFSSSGKNAPKDGIHSRSSLNNGVLGHKTSDRIKRPRRSNVDHEQWNVSSDDGHAGVNVDEIYDKRAMEIECLETLQEVVECLNVPEEVVEEVQIPKRDGQVQGCKLNQANNSFYGVMDNGDMEAFEEDVEEMQFYDGVGEGNLEISNTCRTKQAAEKLAIELLGKRAFTGVELRKKLIAKNFSLNVVETVLSEFQDRGLINDRLYAETFSHSRWKSSSWGPRRIKQALVKKGVSEVDVKKAVKLVFEDGEDCEQRSSTRLSDSSLQQLYVQASKHWQRSQNVTHETRKARVIRWLQYRGFDWAVVSIILKKLESEYTP
ncbi:hypothetical protein BVRB_4g090990 isoform A [Beta vulgaris subsp. vulgaris]|uniref:Regulatory protein RecX n=1 Tax=Beta vulgaris subsp. vulgaris TaxID=3555 RepID=A0A0J8CKN3_BETVV|nr:uncharacterized protein LOC104891999 isoform X1 [Beta vulgaris subsp. vulgaris]KMT12639.1 hypothetical protein BVRB_4g090990 isoform A [Beta vulgaris subsp. vulgaris]